MGHFQKWNTCKGGGHSIFRYAYVLFPPMIPIRNLSPIFTMDEALCLRLYLTCKEPVQLSSVCEGHLNPQWNFLLKREWQMAPKKLKVPLSSLHTKFRAVKIVPDIYTKEIFFKWGTVLGIWGPGLGPTSHRALVPWTSLLWVLTTYLTCTTWKSP